MADQQRKLLSFAFVPRNARFFERRERWGLTWTGWLAVVGLAAALGAVLFFNGYAFLAPTVSVPSDTVVVEGWISVPAAKGAVQFIESNHVSRVIVGGGPIEGASDTQEIKTYAEQGMHRLVRAGLASSRITAVPTPRHERDRTYSEALAIKTWMQSHESVPRSLNVISEAVHARRTRLLFEKAFGRDTKIGIISLAPRDYPPDRWWRYSAGVKDVISEAAGYIYARFFFWP